MMKKLGALLVALALALAFPAGAQTIRPTQIRGVTSDTNTGTSALVLSTSPTLITPNIGVATGTSVVLSGGSGASVGTFDSTNAGGSAINIKNSGTTKTLLGGWSSIIGSGSANDTALSAAGQLGLYSNSTTQAILMNGSAVSMPGTLSVAGTLTSTKDGAIFRHSVVSTGGQNLIIANTGGTLAWGVESSPISLVTGASAYDAFLSTGTGTGLIQAVNFVTVTRTTSAGMAITGTLTATSTINLGTGLTGGLRFFGDASFAVMRSGTGGGALQLSNSNSALSWTDAGALNIPGTLSVLGSDAGGAAIEVESTGGGAIRYSDSNASASARDMLFGYRTVGFGTFGLGVSTAKAGNTFTDVMQFSIGGVAIPGTLGVSGHSALGSTPTVLDYSTVRLTDTIVSSSVSQYGTLMQLTASASATTQLTGHYVQLITPNSAFTLTTAYAYYADDMSKGAASTIGSQYGIYIENQTKGSTQNIGFRSLVSSGANKYNLYIDGTAQNYFGGPVAISSGSNATGLAVTVNDNLSNFAMLVTNSSATATTQYGIRMTLSGDPNDTARFFFQGLGTATERFTARSNGGIANFSANNVNLSDERAKTALVSLDSEWGNWLKMKFKYGAYKDRASDFIPMVTAQDVQKVFPSLVVPFSDKLLGVREAPLYGPVMGKVVQELQHRVMQLEAMLKKEAANDLHFKQAVNE